MTNYKVVPEVVINKRDKLPSFFVVYFGKLNIWFKSEV